MIKINQPYYIIINYLQQTYYFWRIDKKNHYLFIIYISNYIKWGLRTFRTHFMRTLRARNDTGETSRGETYRSRNVRIPTWYRADLVEKENKNKITKKAVLYCTVTKVLPLRLELTFKRRYFVIHVSESPLPTALCMRLWILIVRFH